MARPPAARHRPGDHCARRPPPRPVLAPQYDNCSLPPKLVADEERATLAIRDSNIYFVGFATKAGQWYTFEGRNDLPPSFQAKTLNFGADYESLAGSRDNLPNYPLGRRQTEWAVIVLSHYDPKLCDDQTLKRAVVTIVLTFCEGLTFFLRIRNAIEIGWHSVAHITIEDADRLMCWGQISFMLEYTHLTGDSWESEKQSKRLKDLTGDKCRIYSKAEALAAFDVLVRSYL